MGKPLNVLSVPLPSYKASVLEKADISINDPHLVLGMPAPAPRSIPARELVEGKRMYVVECFVGDLLVGRGSYYVEYTPVEPASSASSSAEEGKK